MRNTFVIYGITINLLFTLTSVEAQDEIYNVQRISEEVRLDGLGNEAFWRQVEPLSMVRQSPNYGETPTERTSVKLAYDDDNFYVLAISYSEDFKNVQDFSNQRDGDCPCDWLGFAIGGDGANPPSGFGFATTPSGNRWDSFLIDGTQLSIDASFNTFWNVATTKDPDVGWTAEFAIPFSSLRFSDKDPSQILMQFVLWRKITYVNEFVVFPDVEPNWGGLSFAKLSEGRRIRFENIQAKKPVYLFPYALGGYQNENRLRTDESGYEGVDQQKREVGVDLKYSITPTLTMDATVNTDFAQVEADNVQINLERSSLFFPEKREFFLERNDKFDFGFTGFNPSNSNFNNAFYSRRIGLDEGVPSRIFGGMRLVGRVGQKWDLGALSMLTENEQEGGDVQGLNVLRVKRQAFGPDTYLGGIVTSRLRGANESENLVGLDTRVKVFSENFLKVALAQSYDENSSFGLENSRYDIRLDRLIEKGWFYTLSHGLVGNEYQPTLGFEERGSRWNNSLRVGYGLFTEGNSKVFRHVFSSTSWIINSYPSYDLESIYADINYTNERKDGSGFWFKPFYQEERLQNSLVFSEETEVPVGDYQFASGQIGYYSPSVFALSANSSFGYGEFYDGNRATFSSNVRWDASRFFKFTLGYQWDDIDFNERSEKLRNHLFSFTSLIMLNTKLSLAGLIQYNQLSQQLGLNIRFRYNPSERRDLFVVFNNNINTVTQAEPVNLPSTQSWNIQVKYTHALAL